MEFGNIELRAGFTLASLRGAIKIIEDLMLPSCTDDRLHAVHACLLQCATWTDESLNDMAFLPTE